MSIFNRRPVEDSFGHFTQRHDDWYTARAVCEQLGLDTDPEHVDTLTVGDFVRLAYNLGTKATESRLSSRDVADGIATAIQCPEAILDRLDTGETDHMWKVRAVQQVIAFGVPR